MTENPDLFGNRSLTEVVRVVREQLGGRAPKTKLVEGVRKIITLTEYEKWAQAAFRTAVLAASKSRGKAEGAEAVYSLGDDVAPLRLFSVSEFEQKGYQLARLSIANRDAVFKLAEVCEEVHGDTFDAEKVLNDVAAEAS